MSNLRKAAMKFLTAALLVAALAFAGCGGNLSRPEAEQYVHQQEHEKLVQEQHREEKEVESVLRQRAAQEAANTLEGK